MVVRGLLESGCVSAFIPEEEGNVVQDQSGVKPALGLLHPNPSSPALGGLGGAAGAEKEKLRVRGDLWAKMRSQAVVKTRLRL